MQTESSTLSKSQIRFIDRIVSEKKALNEKCTEMFGRGVWFVNIAGCSDINIYNPSIATFIPIASLSMFVSVEKTLDLCTDNKDANTITVVLQISREYPFTHRVEYICSIIPL